MPEIVWVDTDDKGRIAAVYTERQDWHRPPVGTTDTPAFRAIHARIRDAEFEQYRKADFAARDEEKFRGLPRAKRIEIVKQRMGERLAEAEFDAADPTATPERKTSAATVLAEARRLIGE